MTSFLLGVLFGLAMLVFGLLMCIVWLEVNDKIRERKSKKACLFCDVGVSTEMLVGYRDLKVKIENGKVVSEPGGDAFMKIHYCPVCGKSLDKG